MGADHATPPAQQRPSSIVDVARLAGVSPATVSRSLRGHAKVAEPTRQRVLQAARQLSYVASPQASSLASGQTRAVAVVVPFLTRWFFSNVVAGAAEALREAGHDVVLYHLGSAADRDRFFERMPLARRVDGVLTISMQLGDEQAEALRALQLPLVTVGPPVEGAGCVRVDEVAAARTAVNHLIHQGHERIGFIGGTHDDAEFGFVSSGLRLRGYRLAMEAAGLEVPDDAVVYGHHGIDGGAAAMARLMSGTELPSAIFAEYDEAAIGAMWALRRAGISVPADISIVGIDDHEMARMLELTTVAQAVGEQGQIAARLVLEGIADPSARPPDVVLPTRLVLRGSTAPPSPRQRSGRPGRSASA